jgi:hypothetical protein
MLCQTCPKRPTCTRLCEKAEKYVSKDSISLREIPQPDISIDLISYHFDFIPTEEISSHFTEGLPNFHFLTPLQNKILGMFYFQGLTYAQIAVRVRHSKKSVDANLARARVEIRGVFSNYECTKKSTRGSGAI